jgi:hypothetical protein
MACVVAVDDSEVVIGAVPHTILAAVVCERPEEVKTVCALSSFVWA